MLPERQKSHPRQRGHTRTDLDHGENFHLLAVLNKFAKKFETGVYLTLIWMISHLVVPIIGRIMENTTFLASVIITVRMDPGQLNTKIKEEPLNCTIVPLLINVQAQMKEISLRCMPIVKTIRLTDPWRSHCFMATILTNVLDRNLRKKFFTNITSKMIIQKTRHLWDMTIQTIHQVEL